MIASKYFPTRFNYKTLFRLFIDLYRSQKFIELISFIIWEIKYLFAQRNKHLRFENKKPFVELNYPFFTHFYAEDAHLQIIRSNYPWQCVFADNDDNFLGCFDQQEEKLYRLTKNGTLQLVYIFSDKITQLYITTQNDIFVCSNSKLYKSNQNKTDFIEVLQFSNPKSYFLSDTFTELPTGDLLVGEYANSIKKNRWEFVGYIYHSQDQGLSWEKIDFLKKSGVNKHIHLLKWCHNVKGLILTDGDNQKNLWLNQSQNKYAYRSRHAHDGWKKINRVHYQKGGYTGIVEIANKIIFGSDYHGGTNFLVSTTDMVSFKSQTVPNPYRRAIFKSLIKRINKNNQLELWANLKFNYSRSVKSLIMLSRDAGESWLKVIEYDGTRFDIDFISRSTKTAQKLFIKILCRQNNFSNVFCICNL